MGIEINVEWVGWLATLILLAGYVSNARKHLYSWLIWFLGNATMFVYALLIGSPSVAFLSVTLMILNVYGYFSWLNASGEKNG